MNHSNEIPYQQSAAASPGLTIDNRKFWNRVEQDGVRYVRLQFTDILGELKSAEVPITKLSKAPNGQLSFDGSSLMGFVRMDEFDMLLNPDLSTWVVLPWTDGENRTGRVICDVTLSGGIPFTGDPRGLLRHTLEETSALGLSSVRVGFELEFFLLRPRVPGAKMPVSRHHNAWSSLREFEPADTGGYFDWVPTDVGERCCQDITSTLLNMGIAVRFMHHELVPGQYEIDLADAPALQAADNLMTAKMVIRTICRQYGLIATFMPKPVNGVAGSGLHFRQSLGVRESNSLTPGLKDVHPTGQEFMSLTVAQTRRTVLDEISQRYLAGLVAHARALTAIFNPTVNSYKRLVPGFEAPVSNAWSTHSRNTFARTVITERGLVGIEVRSPDPTCNPYLAVAASLQAGLDGIRRRLDLPPPLDSDPDTASDTELLSWGALRLPANLEEALDALAEDEVIQSALGEFIYHYFVQAKTIEWEEYRRMVHPWEIDHYLNL